MRQLFLILSAVGLLSAPRLTYAAKPLVGVYEGPSCAVASQQAAFRNMLGRREDIDVLFNDFSQNVDYAYPNLDYGLGCYQHQVANVAISVPMAFTTPGTGGYGMAKGARTLADNASGAFDPYFAHVAHSAVSHGFSHAILRLGWEMSGNYYPWAAAGKEATFVSAFCHDVAVIRAAEPTASFTFTVNPATNTGASGEIPSCATEKGTDAYFQTWTAVGAKAEPAIWNNMLNGYWGLAGVYNFHGDLPRSIPEFGNGGLGDDPTGEAAALAFFTAQKVKWIGFWDSGASYAGGKFSDGSHPGIALEFLKVFGSGTVPAYLAGATLYAGPLTVSAPSVPHILAKLPNGHQALILWAPGALRVTAKISLSAARTMTGVHSDGSRKAFGRAAALSYICSPGSLGVVDLQP